MTIHAFSVKLDAIMKRLLNLAVFLLPIVLPLYVVRFNIGPLPTTVLEIYILLFIGLWGLRRLKNRKPNTAETQNFASLPKNYQNNWFQRWRWPIAAWLVATLIAVFIAPDHWAAFGHWRAFMLEPILMFVVINDLFDTTPNPSLLRRGITNGIATVTIALGIYAVIQYFTGWGIPSPWDDATMRRATGTFGYPNGLSLFIAPFGVVCFMEWIRRVWDGGEQGARMLFLTGAAAAAVSVLLAKSMGGILAFGAGVTLTLVIKKETRKIGLVMCIMGLIGTLAAGALIYRTQLHPLNISDNIATSKKWSSMVRTVIWQESWQIVKAHPVLGTGLRSYPTAILPYHTATWMEVFPHPHNIILMLWIETGLLGLLAFLWICWTWVVVSRQSSVDSREWSKTHHLTDDRRHTTDDWLWIVPLIVILVHGMVDMPYFKNDLAMQFWLLAALATTASKTYHRVEE